MHLQPDQHDLFRYGISNVDISTYIGWDSAGFNQKFNRSNDLRITTFVKIYAALIDLISQKEMEMGLSASELSVIRLDELITPNEVNVAELFNHISHAVEGMTDFLSTQRAEADLYADEALRAGQQAKQALQRP